LYSTLSLYANNKRECYPSISTLADLNNISQRQVDRLIRELKDKKYIIRTGRVITLV